MVKALNSNLVKLYYNTYQSNTENGISYHVIMIDNIFMGPYYSSIQADEVFEELLSIIQKEAELKTSVTYRMPQE